VHSEVVEALREVGIDIEGRKPRGISRDDVEWTDLVVTMGCGDACPVLPGKRYVDWELPDPSGMSLDEGRKLRDEIGLRVSRLGESPQSRRAGSRGRGPTPPPCARPVRHGARRLHAAT